MGVLFSPPRNVRSFRLQVDPIHNIYVEDCGNRNGIPVLFLHGGPGWPITGQAYAVFTNPKKYWCITFHQRGAGKSTPLGCIKNNKTKDIIGDIEKIRKKLDINRWIVTGGSWGATLSLLYASKHTDRVIALVVYGVGIFNKDHLMEASTKTMAPDVYDDWLLADTEQQTFKKYMKGLQSPNSATRDHYAKKWSYEEKLFKLMDFPYAPFPSGLRASLKKARLSPKENKRWTHAMCLIECYYYMNKAFTTPNKMLNDIEAKLKNTPGYLIHGRFDLICSPENSFLIHERWPKSHLQFTDQAGHGMFDQTTAKAICDAFSALARRGHRGSRGRRHKKHKSSHEKND